jgi:hypothetical protein
MPDLAQVAVQPSATEFSESDLLVIDLGTPVCQDLAHDPNGMSRAPPPDGVCQQQDCHRVVVELFCYL